MNASFLESGLNFLPQIVSGLALLLAATALVARRAWPLVLAAALIVGLGVGLAAYKATLLVPGDGRGLRVMTANLLYSNTDVPAFNRAVRASDPDVLVVQERVAFWTEAIGRTLGSAYAILATSPASNTAVYIRKGLPTCPVPELRTPIAENAALGCALIEEVPTLVLGVHAPRPRDPMAEADRIASLAAYRATLAEAGMPHIVAGDFNASPIAPGMAAFLDETSVSMPAEPGVWFASSWPAAIPAVGVRIDHVLVSGEFAARLVRVGPPIGSDHLPVTVDVARRER